MAMIEFDTMLILVLEVLETLSIFWKTSKLLEKYSTRLAPYFVVTNINFLEWESSTIFVGTLFKFYKVSPL